MSVELFSLANLFTLFKFDVSMSLLDNEITSRSSFFSESEIDLDESLCIKNTLKEYILIDELSAIHSGVKASQGSFSLPFDGWIVNNGTKTSIEAATVAGDILNVLNSIVNIEKEQTVTHQGISPHVWVDNISITGEA